MRAAGEVLDLLYGGGDQPSVLGEPIAMRPGRGMSRDARVNHTPQRSGVPLDGAGKPRPRLSGPERFRRRTAAGARLVQRRRVAPGGAERVRRGGPGGFRYEWHATLRPRTGQR